MVRGDGRSRRPWPFVGKRTHRGGIGTACLLPPLLTRKWASSFRSLRRGGGGNRTRVLERWTRTSPGAA